MDYVSLGEFANGAGRLNFYALVFYATGPLAEFLDELRSELEPNHPAPHSHVTVLPPRTLPYGKDAALAQLRRQAAEFSPFRTIVGGIHRFEGTNVVYLSVAHGFKQLHHMHRRLNQDALEYAEPHPYHPHITLAQGLTPEQMPDVLKRARERWDAYTGPRFFPCRSWYFVQATAGAHWTDLAEIDLPAPGLTLTESR
jgi:2'-5' RNA ligase